MVAGICNFCGRHARKHQTAWTIVQVGMASLPAHEECAERYYAQRLHPRAVGAPTLGQRLRDLNDIPLRLRFRDPRPEQPLRFE